MKIFVALIFISLASLLTACDKPVIISPDAVLPNGAVYQGDIENGKFNGNGKLVYPDDIYYEGQFKNGMFNGSGKLVYPDDSFYEGQFENGLYNGKGILVDSEGNKYEGDFIKGKFNGKGLYSYVSKGHYDGEFKDGKYHGIGKYFNDEFEYSGEFVEGIMNGTGRYSKGEYETYEGQIKNWVANGKGIKTKKDGTRIEGNFVDGFLDGEGEIIYSDGSTYKGFIHYDEPDGKGTMNYADQSVYEGEFLYGSKHGNGTLITPETDDNVETSVSGKWQDDELVHDYISGEVQHSQVEIALRHHQDLLDSAHSNLSDQSDDKTDFYFLGVAGDGSQSVFKREIEFIQPLIERRYSNAGKSIVLINHHDTAEQYPMATNLSISSSIEAIANKMDKQNDVLFVYLTSHGSKEHELYLNHDSMDLPSFSAESLGSALESSNIKWKVIIVSACYSGGFIPALKDDTTLVITASDAQNTSFGCSEEAEMTYFGRAFFQEALSKNETLSISAAFEVAKKQIAEWEKDQDLDSSNPQINAPDAIIEKLASIKKPLTLRQ